MYKIASYCELQHRDYVLLRCECGECRYLDMSFTKSHTAEHLILKKSALPLTCDKCGNAHTDSNISLEFQGIRPGFVCEKKKTMLDYWNDAINRSSPNDYPAAEN